MNKTFPRVGWIQGEWGSIDKLSIPLSDRGLNLGDGIFETILILNGQPQLLNNHLRRWRHSAHRLRMLEPPNENFLMTLISEGISRAKLKGSNGSIRINWSRGDTLRRGIDIDRDISPQSKNYRFWLEINPGGPFFEEISVNISELETRNTKSQISQCKTFGYSQSILAKDEAKLKGFDDALLLNNKGSICCGSSANLIIKRKNQWLTPNLQSGCLPGIMRQQGIKLGMFKEAEIEASIDDDDEWILINSLSCKAIKKINDKKIKTIENIKKLWFNLLE